MGLELYQKKYKILKERQRRAQASVGKYQRDADKETEWLFDRMNKMIENLIIEKELGLPNDYY